jgi:hypothetical protein
MASSDRMDVDRSQSNGKVYGEGRQDFGYGSSIFPGGAAAGHNYEQNWNLDPSLGAVNAQDSTRFPQSWHHSPQPHQNQQPQHSQSFNPNNNFYGAQYATSPNFSNQSYAYAGPRSNFNSYGGNSGPLDPSLVAPSTQQNGSLSANAPFYANATGAHSTVAPAALQINASSKSPTPSYPVCN